MKCNYSIVRSTKGFMMLGMLAGLWSCDMPYDIFEPEDRAPGYYVDVNTIHDAVPGNEPRSRYGNPGSYSVFGKKYHVMKSSHGYVERGVASWYGTKFHGRKTSSGEVYDIYGMTAAHKTLPLPTYVRVTNLSNQKSVILKVNDRGPFVENRLIDLSYAAAKKLGIIRRGTGHVEVRAITPGEEKKLAQISHVKKSTTSPNKLPIAARNTRKISSEMFYVQVAAFKEHHNAARLRDKLEAIPVSDINILEGILDNNKIYKVRIGPVANIKLANELTAMLNQRGLTGTHIVTD